MEICGVYVEIHVFRFNSQDKVMSYNNFVYPVDDLFFTELDMKALIKIWGVEKENKFRHII